MPSNIKTVQAVIMQAGSSKVEIWPTCGGILNNWQVQLHNKVWKLVDGYDSEADFNENCETKGFRSCKLSPYTCRLNKGLYDFDETNYAIGKYKLGDHMIHGLLYDVAFDIISSFSDDRSAVLVLEHAYKGTDPGYPFKYTLQVTYALSDNNQLGITSSITNNHTTHIPVADGWHPYFSLGRPVDELELSMQTSDMVEFDEGLIPTGNLLEFTRYNEPRILGDVFLDNCFLLRQSLSGAACRLINRKDNIQVAIYSDKSYSYLQVYTPPHRQSIAIENLSAAPDAFNNHMGLVLLDPGESMTFSTSYRAGIVE